MQPFVSKASAIKQEIIDKDKCPPGTNPKGVHVVFMH